MKVTMTAEAYEQYIGRTEKVGIEAVLRHFQEEMNSGSVMYVKLHGERAVFMRNAYWLYTEDAEERKMMLTKCLAIIQGVSTSVCRR